MSTLHFNSEDFIEKIEKGHGVALVDFFATWCGPCKMLAPLIEDLADELDGSVLVGKLDVDEAVDLAQKYGVMSVPTLLIFKDGRETGRLVGLQSKDAILNAIGNAG